MMSYSINQLNINSRSIASEFYVRIEYHFAPCILMYLDQILCLMIKHVEGLAFLLFPPNLL